MQTKHIIKIMRGHKGRQRLAKEMLVKYIAPLLSVYIYIRNAKTPYPKRYYYKWLYIRRKAL
jgi:hypothetical protein